MPHYVAPDHARRARRWTAMLSRRYSGPGRQQRRMGDTEIIPVIDLGPYLAGVPGAIECTARELRFALTEIGFYFIVNHGVPSAQIREVFRQVARFHAQSLEKKLEIRGHRTICSKLHVKWCIRQV